MFDSVRWAEAFINTMGKDAEEALVIFGILHDWIKKLPGAVFGTASARQLETLIAKGAMETGLSGSRPLEGASRFIILLVRRNQIAHAREIISETEKILDSINKTMPVVLESAVTPSAQLESQITETVKKRFGANHVRLEKKLRPELIGGYRLRIGDELVDASIITQLKNMEAALASGLSASQWGSGPANGGA